MKRILFVGVLALAGWAIDATAASAQVYVRAPFVRVQTGPGLFVQAPFVTIAVPPAPLYVLPPPSIYVPPAANPAPPIQILPQPALAPPPQPLLNAPPAPAVQPLPAQPPVVQVKVMTLNQFAGSFKPRAGTFEVDLLNPVTKQPTKVRFTLPAGTPKRVIVDDDEVVFRYGLFQFVRISFTASGAQVVMRLGR